jgi:transposase
LTIHVHEAEKLSLEQIEAFLNASQEIRFEGETQQQIYHWIEQVLSQQEYHQQSRQTRGLLRSYLTKMTGLSRAQVTRLIARYRKSGSLQPAPYRRHRFPQRYTRADVELLATVDEAHENLSGPATRRILEREYRQYGKPEYERLSTISVAHLFNLRQRPRYREHRLCYTRTRPTAVAIGERRCPDPQHYAPACFKGLLPFSIVRYSSLSLLTWVRSLDGAKLSIRIIDNIDGSSRALPALARWTRQVIPQHDCVRRAFVCFTWRGQSNSCSAEVT